MLLQQTKRQVELFEMHSFALFITVLCFFFLMKLRVVQYCDIMRFMIPCDRHHKVSANPNPWQNSNSFAMHEERDTLWCLLWITVNLIMLLIGHVWKTSKLQRFTKREFWNHACRYNKKYSTSLNLPELQTTIEVTDFISFSLNQEIEAISKFTKNSSKQIMRNDVNIIL